MDLKTLNKFGFLEIALSKKHLKKMGITYINTKTTTNTIK
jgi:hypothetical protein